LKKFVKVVEFIAGVEFAGNLKSFVFGESFKIECVIALFNIKCRKLFRIVQVGKIPPEEPAYIAG
jgi:F0F1-type ATP synthase assembly protein I